MMNGKIGKIQSHPDAYKVNFLFYNRARDAMFDIVNELFSEGYRDIYIPGYIGWSPKEGSGIFDPLNAIEGLGRHYYQMTKDLTVNLESVREQLKEHSILLVVNYFGFRDPKIRELIEVARFKDCIVIEDNAHGFYTYFCNGSVGADITFFSLHKMLPFQQGGGLMIENNRAYSLHNLEETPAFNPFVYNYNEIAKIRLENYKALLELLEQYHDYFEPLRGIDYLNDNIPQTFPVVIKQGNRDKVYELMNDAGYGVVSLYHTMIEELQNNQHAHALWLSKRIMNLPVHQDVDRNFYGEMVETLKQSCIETR